MKSKLAAGAVLIGLAMSAGPANAEPELFVYKGAGCTGLQKVPEFEKFIGRKVDGVVDFAPLSNWTELMNWTNWSVGCWSATKYKLALGVPMITSDGSTSLAQGATGAYDHYFRDFGKLLVSKGRPNAYLRIGWEFNGDWYAWSAYKNPTAFRAYFRRIVAALRSVPGQHFTIVWNPSQGIDKVAPDQAYPGDDVVDMIGLDAYNSSWNPRDSDDPAVRWQDRLEGDYGLNWAADFAKRHGKRLVVPEWGTGTRPDGHGFGDDPLFIRNMMDWMNANDVVFDGYWDYPASDYNAEISGGQYPKAAEALKAALNP